MVVNYSKNFVETFSHYSDRYVIIGGTATALQLAQTGITSRTTKDYDMVVIDENKDREFYEVLVRFLKEGDYIGSRLENEEQLFRFETKKEDYPQMIELFSKNPEFALVFDNFKTPIHFDDGASLSALLLDDDYYFLLSGNIEKVENYSILSAKALIIFKAKAWMDLRKRKEAGYRADSRDIKKHLSDIVRLVGSLDNLESIPTIPVSIQNDMTEFMQQLTEEMIPENKDLGITKKEVCEYLKELLGD